MKQRFGITGMYCSACSSRIGKTVSGLDGVTSADVNLISNSMTVDYDPDKQSFENICDTVKKLGYGAGEYTYKAVRTTRADGSSIHRLILSFVFLVLLMVFSMQHMLGYPLPVIFHNKLVMSLTQLVLTLPVVLLNFGFFTRGFGHLFRLSPNMDSLVALGSAAALVYSLIVTVRTAYSSISGTPITGDTSLYYESAGMILTLVALGKYLEAKGKRNTGKAIEGLMRLTPREARVLKDGSETIVPITEVRENDLLVALPGELFAVDGTVIEGASSADTSAITGESIPREITVGDSVTAATANLSGKVLYRAEKVGEDTVIAQIIHLVEEAGGSPAPISRLADKISLYFVPSVIGIAVVVSAIWLLLGYGISFALGRGISVLVISCPCALGLATPAAIMAGIGAGAGHGILVKSAEVLETAHKVDTVILDKTGTLTEGKPTVCGVYGDVLEYAVALEKNSTHPLSHAVLEYAKKSGCDVPAAENFKSIAGMGLTGTVNGSRISGGSRRYMAESGIDFSRFEKEIEELENKGATLLLFAKENTASGVIGAVDMPKADSADAVNKMKAMGKTVIMLTGDSDAAASAVASSLGLDSYRSGVLPADKESVVRSLMKDGMTTAMIGDGINDAPALTAANVGIAIGAGTEIAIEAADIVLVGSRLSDAVTALRLGNAVIKNIRMSLFWAFFYNTVGIPVAAGVLYGAGILLSPMFAAAAMSLSSVCVVLNALRLRKFR